MSWQSGLYQTPVLAILLMGWVLPFLLMLLVRKNSLGVFEFEWGVFLFFLCCLFLCWQYNFYSIKKKKKVQPEASILNFRLDLG